MGFFSSKGKSPIIGQAGLPDYDEYDAPYNNTWSYGYGYSYAPTPSIDIHEALQPLTERLREYDFRRLELERRGGRLADLEMITEILKKPIRLSAMSRGDEVAIADQRHLRNIVHGLSYDLHFQVRQLATQMPVYYICRTKHDYWHEYSLVIEDLYLSPGYPMSDERFVRLMDLGHETYFLRVAQFRAGVESLLAESGGGAGAGSWRTDEMLYNLGRHVFQAAWHDDQRLAVAAARHLGLPTFHQAIELLYLCLSGELCELRGAVNAPMLRFFEEVHPQAGIRTFLGLLSTLEGGMLTTLPQKAGVLHRQLSAAFSRFLSLEVDWGFHGMLIPLWKILYANFARLDIVGKSLMQDRNFGEGARRLESDAQAVIDGILKIGKVTK